MPLFIILFYTLIIRFRGYITFFWSNKFLNWTSNRDSLKNLSGRFTQRDFSTGVPGGFSPCQRVQNLINPPFKQLEMSTRPVIMSSHFPIYVGVADVCCRWWCSSLSWFHTELKDIYYLYNKLRFSGYRAFYWTGIFFFFFSLKLGTTGFSGKYLGGGCWRTSRYTAIIFP